MFSSLRKLRRRSDTQSNTGADLQRINSISSATSGSGKTKAKRPRSRSLTRKLSFFGNVSDESIAQNSLVSSSSDLADNTELVELSRFKSLNYDKFNKTVLQYLKFQGLSAPRIIYDSSVTGVRMAVSSSGENVFLPSLVVLSDEEQMDNYLNSQSQRNESTSTSTTRSDLNVNDNGPTVLEEESRPRPHGDDTVISHTVGVIVSLAKPTSIAAITTRLETICKIKWPRGLPSDHYTKSECFDVAQMNWDLDLSNYNFFVPAPSPSKFTNEGVAPDAVGDEIYDYDGIDVGVDETKFITEQKIRPKVYELKSIDQVARGGYSQFSFKGPTGSEPFIAGNLQRHSGSILYPPGDYIFLLPIQFPPSTPESLITEKASVSHVLRTIIVPKGNKTYYYGDDYINILRGPPVTGVTTADKPVYVNKVWSESLNYEISFPKKYVAIGSEIPIKMKFAPLKKNVAIKRVKINLLETITYASKDLRYEYVDQSLRRDPTLRDSRDERVIPLVEIKSQSRLASSIREEIVSESLLSRGNLLSLCYEPVGEGYDEVIGPLQISSYVPFIKPQKPAKYYGDGDNPKNETFVDLVLHNPERSKKKVQVTKQFQTKLVSQGTKITPNTIVNPFSDGIFADSSNNRYVSISHKLQISLRISRKLEEDEKVHNYEVMIDTPLVLLNSGCVPESVDLPAYEDGDTEEDSHLPSFEEATSPMSSPQLLPTEIPSVGFEETNLLSRTSTLGSSSAQPKYDHIDSLIDSPASFTLDSRNTARTELLNNLRRTATHDLIKGESDEEPTGGEPPSYNEVAPLLSDTESLPSSFESDRRPSYPVNPIQSQEMFEQSSTDLTDQLRRVSFG